MLNERHEQKPGRRLPGDFFPTVHWRVMIQYMEEKMKNPCGLFVLGNNKYARKMNS